MNRIFAAMFVVWIGNIFGAEMLTVNLHKYDKTADGKIIGVTTETNWDPKKTAIIVCDMWDDHWCKGAAARVGELAKPMNKMLIDARAKGIFIIHAPSSVTNFYKDTPQRKLAQAAPFVKTPVELSTADRWGTKWCWPDAKREPDMPIDDSDMGCDCEKKCTIREAWTREIKTLEMKDGDALTDNGQETWNLLCERGIDNVILCGVHLNMCVLGRPFAIRQMVQLGKNVALMRDMTDTMYNHEKRPMVDHFTGTDLVIEHVEKYWCPSFTSTDITGKPAFVFKEREKMMEKDEKVEQEKEKKEKIKEEKEKTKAKQETEKEKEKEKEKGKEKEKENAKEKEKADAATKSTPWMGKPHKIPGTIEAENFDLGPAEVAYHDTTPENQGDKSYREETGVDIEARPDASNKHGIGWTRAGEWILYTVDVKQAGTYTVEFPVASNKKGGVFHLEFDGQDVTGKIEVPDTGAWTKLQTIEKTGVKLKKGVQVLKLSLDAVGESRAVGDIDLMRFTRTGD